ncbi:MAG TPA: DUF2779 domain-containing protein [Ignavibacteriaceae bacterium]|nr:DUF2779 domain-containing protein [Ignavibacteriaceae bacterium]
MANHLLSKSSFIKGIQCDKQLYLYKYHYNWMDKVSESQQAIFNRGTNVGVLAQQLFANGTIATDDPRKSDEAVAKTKALIEKGCQVIYEAAFLYDNILVISDIIVKEGRKWNIYEVKSSTSISETYLLDASIQYYVLLNCGIEINDISIIYINNQYIRNGNLNIQSLFNIESIIDKVTLQQDFVARETSRLKEVLKGKVIPQIPIGKQCSDPYPCSFMGYCWRDVPEYSVFDIANLKTEKKFELYNQGYIKLEDIPTNYGLNDKQWMQVNSHITNETIIDKAAIKEFLSDITYPLYFMDFESFMPAIPMFNGSRPYQQIPFQYSLHYMRNNGSTLEHFEFLADATGDPRIPFITKLLNDTINDGVILVYNKSFEITRLKEIAKDFPEFSIEIEKRISRIVDLMIPFQKRYYYTPGMKGSYSIKYVLPALVSGLSYDNLEIKEGGTASSVFESLYYETDLFSCAEIKKDLLEYCKMDTLAMVEIFKILQNI